MTVGEDKKIRFTGSDVGVESTRFNNFLYSVQGLVLDMGSAGQAKA